MNNGLISFENKINYPNPVFIRERTVLLDGKWEFRSDKINSRDINVPFCPQSALSGIGFTDFISVCYYKKRVNIERAEGESVIIKFGAADYLSVLFVNGKYVGKHTGGFTSFSFDITDFVVNGENSLELTVYDSNGDIAFGKQSYAEKSFGCFYTRTTGIWQSVWLEYSYPQRILSVMLAPDAKNNSVSVDLRLTGKGNAAVEIFYDGKLIAACSKEVKYRGKFKIPLSETHLWGVGEGNVYDVIVSFGKDRVQSYFGLRDVCYNGYRFLLNGKSVFQKLVLDQGFNPQGIYTSPSTDFMLGDIKRALKLGFNGARLHQKVFEPKFLYLCDKLGYLVWGEFPSWGADYSHLGYFGEFISQWQEAVSRDFNHPSVITWCPLNETWGYRDDFDKKRDVNFVEAVYKFTKRLDPTRPCVDTSGGHHGGKTDLFDFHCYESAEKVAEYLKKLDEQGVLDMPNLYCEGENVKYSGGAVNISEYGGFSLNDGAENADSWGYGNGANGGDEFVNRYSELTRIVFSCKKLSGFCYTQLYDVEQEKNGFYRYDRTPKLSEEQIAEIRKVNSERDE